MTWSSKFCVESCRRRLLSASNQPLLTSYRPLWPKSGHPTSVIFILQISNIFPSSLDPYRIYILSRMILILEFHHRIWIWHLHLLALNDKTQSVWRFSNVTKFKNSTNKFHGSHPVWLLGFRLGVPEVRIEKNKYLFNNMVHHHQLYHNK